MCANFIKKETEEWYLRDTPIENIFINEYLPASPAEYVKIYIFAYMYAETGGYMDNETIAEQMGMQVEDVLKAWSYWEKLGVINKHFTDEKDKFSYRIEFVNLKDGIYGIRHRQASSKEKYAADKLSDSQLKKVYQEIEKITGRVLGGKEPVMILEWIEELGASKELIVKAYKYCKEARRKDDPRYVATIVREWAGRGLLTEKAIEDHLEEVDQRHYMYRRIMRALGFSRNATEREQHLIDGWFDSMGYTIERILEACGKTSGISNPNINYVDRVLKNWAGEKKPDSGGRSNEAMKAVKTVNIADVKKYYDSLNRKANQEAEDRKAEIYKNIPDIKKIDDSIKELGMRLSRIIISGASDAKKQMEKFKSGIQALEVEKQVILEEKGYPSDYMEVKYGCDKCKDTGTNDMGERCECYGRRLKEVEAWQNS